MCNKFHGIKRLPSRGINNSVTFLVVALLVVYNGCKDKSVEPTPPPKDLRKLTWKIDTLAYPGNFQTNMFSIWGSSAQDVYVVGHSSDGPGSLNDGTKSIILHGKMGEDLYADETNKISSLHCIHREFHLVNAHGVREER